MNVAVSIDFENQPFDLKGAMTKAPKPIDIVSSWVGFDELSQLSDEWRALADAAVEPNPFYEEQFLLNSLKFQRKAGDYLVLLLKDAADGKLLGLFPFDYVQRLKYVLRPRLQMHSTLYVAKTVPLIAHIDPIDAWAAAFEAINARKDVRPILESLEHTINRPAAAGLLALADRDGLARIALAEYDRPMMACAGTSKEYLARLSSRRRRSLNQSLRKIEAVGAVSVESAQSHQPNYAEFLEIFFKLEASGWKGKEKTAFLSRKELEDYGRATFAAGTKPPLYCVDILKLDDVPIAANLNLIGGRGVFTLKAAYDEEYYSYGPGVLLDHLTSAQWLDEKSYDFVDSCATPAAAVNSLWLEKEAIQQIAVAVSKNISLDYLEVMKRRHELKIALKDKIKALLKKLKKD